MGGTRHKGIFHVINSPEGFSCGSNFLLGDRVFT